MELTIKIELRKIEQLDRAIEMIEVIKEKYNALHSLDVEIIVKE